VKLLHVIPTVNPASGGPAEALRQLVRAYPEYAVEAEIVTQDEPGSEWLATFQAKVHALGGRNNTYGRSPVLRAWLDENVKRFDGVVAHALWVYSSVAAARAARRNHVPYAVFTHGMLDPWFKKQYPRKHLKKYLYWPIQYPALRHAKAVLFTTTLECDLAPQSFWPNHWTGKVVPYGTNPPPQNIEAQHQAFEAALPRLKGRRFLLFLSRIHEKKGCDLLVQAFAAVINSDCHPERSAKREAEGPAVSNPATNAAEIHLVLAGPDKDGLQPKLAALAEQHGITDRVHFPGMLTGDAKWGALRACDAMVLPSHQENFGVIVAEALACGRPVLISNQVNVWPQIEQDRVGFVAPDTLEGTQSLLTRWLILRDSEKIAMTDRALLSFKSRYSMADLARTLRDLFAN
jgi:glycosyltransferase involved in cell wall biosynthesis